jgi:hypothetical protein
VLLLGQQRSVVVTVTQKKRILSSTKEYNACCSPLVSCTMYNGRCTAASGGGRHAAPCHPAASANKQNKSLSAAGHGSYHTQSVTPTLVCVQD